MRRHVLYGRYGTNDSVAVRLRDDETGTEINLISPSNELEHGIGGALVDLERIGLFPSTLGLDLLVLALHVQAADTRISRTSESQDSWTREIRIVVPVTTPELWATVGPIIKRALDFLTGDRWIIEFRSKPRRLPNLAPSPGLHSSPHSLDGVSLFSGGLDSLVGAIDVLEQGGNPVLVGHVGDGPTSAAQSACLKGLIKQYGAARFKYLRLWMDLRRVEVRGSEHEKTMRGRSFLFFAAGILAATSLNKEFKLLVPENGFIALNVPLDPLRLGSHSTRTTHPFYVARWNEMLKALGIPGRIENPYWDKTKGEMIESCANKVLLEKLMPRSLSCSSPSKGRWLHKAIQQCGYCLPCLIRRAAILRGLGAGMDETVYTISDLTKRVLDSTEAEGQQVRSVQLAASRLNRRPGLAPLLIHTSGSLSDESKVRQEALVDMYRRGLAEVEQLIKDVRTEASK